MYENDFSALTVLAATSGRQSTTPSSAWSNGLERQQSCHLGRTRICSGAPAATRSRTEDTIRAPCRPISATAISSTRCAIRRCRRRGLRISGGTDITADLSRRNFSLQPPGGTNARQTCALANRLGYRRGVLSEESRLHRRWRPPSPRSTSFASRTNWSPFPPVRITVPLCAAGARARTTCTFPSGVWLFASQWARKIRCPESGKPPNPIGLD